MDDSRDGVGPTSPGSGAGPIGAEAPKGIGNPELAWGSDIAAEMLRRLNVPYIALNPGASFRGFHDSLVNYLGNRTPEMLLCLHEQHAVAIAHGFAKVSGSPMATAIHSNVGLMNSSMAIYNAWCDRVPMLIIGATGPVDAAKRRPWIDWIHTTRDQANIVRNYTKWDDQPASVDSLGHSLVRAWRTTATAPTAPAYVVLDVGVQETPLDELVTLPDPTRFLPHPAPSPDSSTVKRVAALLQKATAPVILSGRIRRTDDAWHARVQLAEATGATVISDIKVGATFPTRHPQHPFAPAFVLDAEAHRSLAAADLILSLDWSDLGGTLRSAGAGGNRAPRIVHASLDHALHNGWSMDHMEVAPIDIGIACDADELAAALVDVLPAGECQALVPLELPVPPVDAPLTNSALARLMRDGFDGRQVTYVRLPLGWPGRACDFQDPLDFLGLDGGGGIGSGPGLTVGAALALKGIDRLAVGVLGDGDLLMGLTALWTAAKYKLPALFIISNNRSFYNDEEHQHAVAVRRGRPTENKWIGQRLDDPAPDLAVLAKGQGVGSAGPVRTPEEFRAALKKALQVIDGGAPFLIDAHVDPGYEADPSGIELRARPGADSTAAKGR